MFYVSPNSLFKDINFLYENFGSRKACLVNEITKLHEKTVSFCLGDDLEIEPRGEYVLVVEGATVVEQVISDLSIEQQLKELIDSGIRKNDAVKQVAQKNNISRNEVYKIAINL